MSNSILYEKMRFRYVQTHSILSGYISIVKLETQNRHEILYRIFKRVNGRKQTIKLLKRSNALKGLFTYYYYINEN